MRHRKLGWAVLVAAMIAAAGCSGGSDGGVVSNGGGVGGSTVIIDGQSFTGTDSNNLFYYWSGNSAMGVLLSFEGQSIGMMLDFPGQLPHSEAFRTDGFGAYGSADLYIPQDGYRHQWRACGGQITITDHTVNDRLRGTFYFSADRNYSASDPPCANGQVLRISGEFDVRYEDCASVPRCPDFRP